MNLGENIYQYRTSKNLSQGDLADKLDVSRQSVSKWENNSAIPDLDKIVRLCEIFEISIDALVKGVEHTADTAENNTVIQSGNWEQAKPAAVLTKEEKSADLKESTPSARKDNLYADHNTGFTGRKLAGTILMCMAFLSVLVLTIMGNLGAGLIFAVPFVVCGLICFIFKKNAGLWCAWAVHFMIDMYLQLATSVRRGIISNVYYYLNRGFNIHLFIGWCLYIALAILTLITVLRFKNKPLEMNRKTRNLMIAGIVIAVIIKILQLVLPMTAYYSYLLAHIIDLSTVHSILYGLIDWIKVGIVVALITNFARYRLKPTVIVSASVILLSITFGVVSSVIVSDQIAQNNNQTGQNAQSEHAGSGFWGNESAFRDKSLYEHGLDVVAMLEEIINSEEYVQAFSGSQEIMNVIQEISTGDYAAPPTVYKITLDMDNVLKTSDMLDMENASEALIANLKNRVLASIVTTINARSGALTLAASSVCTTGKTFVSSEIQEEMIYLYVFEDAAPVAVTFTLGEDNAINATGNFLLYEEIPAGSVQELLEYLGAYSVEIEIVEE